jgi:hypothetical protein
MPVAIPQTVRRALGEEAVVDFMPWMERWLSESIKEKAVPRDEYREVLSRLEILEHDVSDIKTDVRELRREMNERFDRVNERFDRVNERFDEIGARFDGRLGDMHHQMIVQTRWLIGSLALIGTVVSVLLAIAQFTP